MAEAEKDIGEDEDDEEFVDEAGYKTVKDAVLFAIDVSESMLNAPPVSESRNADTSSPVIAALKCAYSFMQQRIISDPKAMMGILLYGTEATKFYDDQENSRGTLSYPHCFVLNDLEVPEAENVKSLKRLVEDESSQERNVLKPSSEPVSMSSVLFCANQILTMRAPNFSSRRLFIVTDNDNPHADNKALRSSAAVRAKDLYDLGVVIELFPISTPTHTFDRKAFYDDIIYSSSPRDPDAPSYNPSIMSSGETTDFKTGSTDGISLLQALLSSLNSRSTPRRTLFSSVPLELAPGFRISLKGYLLFKRQTPTRSCYVYLGSDRPLLAKGSTVQQADDSARTIEKFEIRKAYQFGGEQVAFTPAEIKQLRSFGDPIIRLIGFKPIALLPFWANVKQSTFLYPSDDDYVGSSRVFSALHQKLVKSKLMAVTWFIARRNATPVIAALIPTLENPDLDASSNLSGISASGVPQGLHLVPLPFADDIRQNPAMPHGDDPLRAPDGLTDKMRNVIQQLSLPGRIYDPHKYPNPALQWHYRILQALALDEDLPQKGEDKTVPRYRQIDKRVGNEVTEWGIELEKAAKNYVADSPNAGGTILTKRPANGDGVGSSKRVKTESGSIIGEQELRQIVEKGQLERLTVAHLRDWLTSKNLNVAGRKAELIERVEAWFETR